MNITLSMVWPATLWLLWLAKVSSVPVPPSTDESHQYHNLDGHNYYHNKRLDQATPFRPIQLTLQELQKGSRQHDLKEALATHGMVAVVESHEDSPPTQPFKGREIALEHWCQCHHKMASTHQGNIETTTKSSPTSSSMQVIYLQEPNSNNPSSPTRTKRTTLASATIGDASPLALDSNIQQQCGEEVYEAMEDLRDSIHQVTEAFVKALDAILAPHAQPLLHDVHGKSYTTLASVIQAATHLEHYHVYEKQAYAQDRAQAASEEFNNPDTSSMALDFHTDAGLFLAFVPGYDCQHDHAPSSASITPDSFWIRDDGQARPVEFAPHTRAVIMLGAGAEQWLDTKDVLHLKATQHAVQIQPQQTRAWYGKMHLVPDQAIVQTVPITKTFRDLKDSVTTTSIELATGRRDERTVQRLTSPSLGCGDVAVPESTTFHESTASERRRRRRLQHVGAPGDCNNVTNFFCWFQCLEIPNAEQVEGYLNEGYSLYCLDPAVLASSGNKVSAATEPCQEGYVHNGACQGSWQPTAPGVPTTVTFARNTSNFSSEFCYGGVSMYMDGFHWVHDSLCVVYLFPGWVLSSRTKLAMASVGTLFMGIVLEGVIWQRRQVVKSMKAGVSRLGVGSLYYGLQLTLGYFIMLIVMTYSGVLFLCSISGLVIGNIVFNAKDGPFSRVFGRKEPGVLEAEDEELPARCNCADGKTSGDPDLDIPDGATPCCQHGL